MSMELLAILTIIGTLLLALSWTSQYGWKQGLLAIVLRVIWLIPLMLAFLPRTRHEQVPQAISVRTIHALIDDSLSMTEKPSDDTATPLTRAEKVLTTMTEECQRLGCKVKPTRLSELNPEVQNGFTPLQKSVTPWLLGLGGDPWVVLSDGGDSTPSEPWSRQLSSTGKVSDQTNGLIMGIVPHDLTNLWLEMDDAPLFSFANKPLTLSMSAKREKPNAAAETVQIQALADDKILATTNATFVGSETAIDIQMTLPALPKGEHLLAIRALPLPGERSLWDNTLYKNVEVLPNTIGLLHLLGTPSWDGRFLRRYLKSEPKFDLISFFILRDPSDVQMVNERELSLIPFPVERLFTEELPNFHNVIIQNFALYQFLDPMYQDNLVNYVKNGGSLLFIGGPRSLQLGDLTSSPLASILPFDLPTRRNELEGARTNTLGAAPGVPYDADLRFKIGFAEPTLEQRSLASVYDDWHDMATQLESYDGIQGIHRTDMLQFKTKEVTPLLTAKLDNGQTLPLAVASYPGKGRAIWIFSDSFWRMAMQPNKLASRFSYNDFWQKTLTWLLRQEMEKPLVVKRINLAQVDENSLQWDLQLIGPASRYYDAGAHWQLTICGILVPENQIRAERLGPETWALSGSLFRKAIKGDKCQVDIRGEHPAFGSVKLTTSAHIPETIPDLNLVASRVKLNALASLTGAQIEFLETDTSTTLTRWLESLTQQDEKVMPAKFKTIHDYYWLLDSPWFWLCLLALPVEVLIRRWQQLVSARKSGATAHGGPPPVEVKEA